MMMNCIAVLGNIIPQLVNVDYFAAERIVLLIEVVYKKYLLHRESQSELADASLDFLRLLFDALSSCLGSNRNSNPFLVYSLLSRKITITKALGPETLNGGYGSILALLGIPRHSSTFLHCLTLCLDFVQSEIEKKTKGTRDADLLPSGVLSAIQTSFLESACPSVEVKERVSFKYEEDPSASEFFIKFIWGFIVNEGSFQWSPEKTRLFSEPEPQPETEVHIEMAPAPKQSSLSSSESSV